MSASPVGLQSSFNACYYSTDYKSLINPRVVFTNTAPLTCTNTAPSPASEYANTWSLQINCANAVADTEYQQFVIQFEFGDLLNALAAIAANSLFLGEYWESLYSGLAQPLPAGYTFDITVNTDPNTRDALGMTTLLYGPGDALSADVTSLMSSIDITQGTYVPSPIDTLSVELVGIGSGSRGTFTTGAGAMNLYPSGGQTYAWTPAVQVSGGNPYSPVPPEFGFTQQEMGNHTAEQSNIDWSNPAFQEDGSWLQLWQYGSYPVTGIKSNTVIITVT